MNIERQFYNKNQNNYDTLEHDLEYWIGTQFSGGIEKNIAKLINLVSIMATRMAEADQLTAREIADAIDDSD